MSTPLQDMPELRATFRADSGRLLEQAARQLASLSQPGTDFALAPVLLNTIHALRGAAAMVGAQKLTLLIDEYQRLVEVADKFKVTARDQAQQAFAFLQAHFELVGRAVQAALADQDQPVEQCYQQVRRSIADSWGEQLRPDPAENPEAAGRPRVGGKMSSRSARPASRTTTARRSDRDAVAREFLTSLGVSEPAPAPATAQAPSQVEPEPASPVEQVDADMLSYFVLETNDSLTQLEGLLLAWEKQPEEPKTAQTVFRLVHTIKGAANSLGLTRIGGLLHGLEDLLESHVVDRSYPRLAELIEVLLGVSDSIKAIVREVQTGVRDGATIERVARLNQRIAQLASEPPPSLQAPPAPSPQSKTPLAVAESPKRVEPKVATSVPGPSAPLGNPEAQSPAPVESTASVSATPEASPANAGSDHPTVRVESERLDLLMNLIGELVISRSRLEKKLADISRLKEEMFFGKSRLLHSITDFQRKYEYSRPVLERRRLAHDRIGLTPPSAPRESSWPPQANPKTLSGFSELEFDHYDDFNILARTLMEIGNDSGEIFSQLNRFFDAFGEETGHFSKITARLQDEITRVRMIPLTLLFQRLKRAVRDAARKEDKEINLVTQDNGTRLDKLMLDQLYTPLLHIVRNAVSHGIEARDIREAAGKPGAGQLQIRAGCDANQVVLEISDDGCGLDLESIRQTAVRQGLLVPQARISEDALVQLIFQPGFTTVRNVTEVSGRGVGLDIVRQEIARMSGSVQVRSVAGQGCTFVIHLPLTLAINQAMFITAGKETCALPLNFVERIQEVQEEQLTASGQQELVDTPQGMVPLVRLRRLMNLPEGKGNGAVILARVGDRRLALGVDRILRKQDIVVKPLGPLLQGHPLFSGATLGGDGQVVMILDLPRLLANDGANLRAQPGAEPPASGLEAETPSCPTILVVDDSLSVRKVIEKHLVSLQFKVELAVDGLDALEKLRTRPVSLVLTDLEMPRMHGFELIAEIRRYGAQNLPIIVVTSRDAEKHRQRATALGANDYIIKPFSREQLAEYIHRHLAASPH